MSDKTATHPLRAVPGFYGDHPGIQIGTYVSDGTSDEHLQLLQQLDVKWAMYIINERDRHTAEYYKKCRERLAPVSYTHLTLPTPPYE